MGFFAGEWCDAADDPFHFLDGARDDAGRFAFHVDPLRAGMFLDVVADPCEQFFGALEQSEDFLLALFVPWRVWHPAAELVGNVNFAFARDDPIGEEGESAFEKSFDHVDHRAPGVDAPACLMRFADVLDQFKKLRRDRRARRGVVQSAIEIKRQNRGWLGERGKCPHAMGWWGTSRVVSPRTAELVHEDGIEPPTDRV